MRRKDSCVSAKGGCEKRLSVKRRRSVWWMITRRCCSQWTACATDTSQASPGEITTMCWLGWTRCCLTGRSRFDRRRRAGRSSQLWQRGKLPRRGRWLGRSSRTSSSSSCIDRWRTTGTRRARRACPRSGRRRCAPSAISPRRARRSCRSQRGAMYKLQASQPCCNLCRELLRVWLVSSCTSGSSTALPARSQGRASLRCSTPCRPCPQSRSR
mmetsp:Transcript_24238/g.61663  ORF Transcript_24238/g.61663 Transcript_24238/m.61663 type:complete len:213 (-) Transcript_24238:746-1384(-)